MNKKHFLFTVAITMLSIAIISCDKSNTSVNKSSSSSSSTETTSGDLRIAYVEVDSLMTQYKFCKDYSQILQKKGQNIQNTLAQKQQQLQTAAANFQQKLQQNAYTREQAQAIEAGLQKQNNDLQVLNQRLSTEFQTETEKYNTALRDSLQHFLVSYNKDKKFSIILSKAGDNILYADKALDITKEVVAGLNKTYKPTSTLKEAEAKK